MKDFLLETIKLEEKIRRGALLKDYYSGTITWLQYCDEVSKLASVVDLLSEQSNINPDFRAILEQQMYPIDFWVRKNTNKS